MSCWSLIVNNNCVAVLTLAEIVILKSHILHLLQMLMEVLYYSISKELYKLSKTAC